MLAFVCVIWLDVGLREEGKGGEMHVQNLESENDGENFDIRS